MAERRKDLPNAFDRSHPFAKPIMEGWTEHSPVDCLVISPEFDVMGKLQLNNFFDDCYKSGISDEVGYLTFLNASLDVKFPGFNENTSTDPLLTGANIVLDSEHHEENVLHILRAPRHGEQDYNVITIDTTAFENGGTLTIEIQMGSAISGGSFDLFDNDTELPTKGTPTETVASVWDIPSGQKGTIHYQFDKGIIFKLGATGTWFSGKGNINAFHAKISVEENY